jgi:hypothetical protein
VPLEDKRLKASVGGPITRAGGNPPPRRGGDGMKARLFRLSIALGSLATLLFVLGAPRKW